MPRLGSDSIIVVTLRKFFSVFPYEQSDVFSYNAKKQHPLPHDFLHERDAAFSILRLSFPLPTPNRRPVDVVVVNNGFHVGTKIFFFQIVKVIQRFWISLAQLFWVNTETILVADDWFKELFERFVRIF